MMIGIHLEDVSIVAAILGGFVICFGLVSFLVKEKLYLSEALVATSVGIVIGPAVLKTFDPKKWGDTDDVMLGFTRIAISIQLMFSGVVLPKAYLVKEMKSLLVLLFLVMTYMLFVSGLIIWWFIPNLSFLESLAIAACVTRSDPILANSVVKGRFADKHVPLHVRNILSAESASNDGLAYPFLYFVIFLLNKSPSMTTVSVGIWILLDCLYQVVLSIIVGIAIGYGARKLLYFSEKRQLIDKQSFLVFAIALALFLMGSVSIIGGNEFLSCFIAGTVFSWDDWFRKETEEAHLQEVIDMLLNLTICVYFGSIIPWSTFAGGDITEIKLWQLFACSIMILVFRRLPAIVAFKPIIPAIKTYYEAVLIGWFGPIGMSAIYYAIIIKQETFSEEDPSLNLSLRSSIEPVIFFLVLSSLFVHGITIPLVKISNKINTNTRTLTAGSLNNQVARLPLIKFGTQLLFKVPKTNEQEPPNDPVPEIELNAQGQQQNGVNNRQSLGC